GREIATHRVRFRSPPLPIRLGCGNVRCVLRRGQASVSRWASVAAGAAVLLAGGLAPGATADRSPAALPSQVWGLSLGQPAPAGVLAAARRAGVNALILDPALRPGARASLRRGAGAAG